MPMTARGHHRDPRRTVRSPRSRARSSTRSIRSSSVEPADLVEVCRFLRDDPRLQFDLLNCISGVDYLETGPEESRQGRLRAAPGSRLSPLSFSTSTASW